MDYRKINSHIILLLIVFVVGLTIAMLGRLIVLDKGADAGSSMIRTLVNIPFLTLTIFPNI